MAKKASRLSALSSVRSKSSRQIRSSNEMAEKKTRVALVQMKCGSDPDKNLARGVGFIRDAAKKGAEIVCLPELFRSQYFCQTEDHANFALAEEVPGRSTSSLGEIARELGVVIVASLFEKRGAGV